MTANNDSITTQLNTFVTLDILENDTSINITGIDLDINTGGVQSEMIVPGQGTFSVDNSGVLSFTPVDNFTGTASLEYQAIDNTGATSNIANVSISVYTSNFREDTSISLPGVSSSSVAWADYTGDGKQDCLLTGETASGPISKLYKNTGSGFVEDTNITLPSVSSGSVTWADYNGDGQQDFLLTGSSSSSGYISKLYKNTGSGFLEDTNISLPGVAYGSIAWADYNGDGQQDFLLTGYIGSYTGISKMYKNTGSGFLEDTNISLPNVYSGSVAWADYNDDGKQDFLLTGNTGSVRISKLYKNTGSGFVEDTSISLPGVVSSSVAWADYTGDGKPDFLLTGGDNGFRISKLYKNTGSGFVEDTNTSLPGVDNSSVAWADYTGDGKQDFLLTGYFSSSVRISKLYKNTGSGFVDSGILLPSVAYGEVAWADYSGDGKQDFLLTGSTGSGYTKTS